MSRTSHERPSVPRLPANHLPPRALRRLRGRDDHAAGVWLRLASTSSAALAAASGLRVEAGGRRPALRAPCDRRGSRRAEGPRWERRARQSPEPVRSPSSAQDGDRRRQMGSPCTGHAIRPDAPRLRMVDAHVASRHPPSRAPSARAATRARAGASDGAGTSALMTLRLWCMSGPARADVEGEDTRARSPSSAARGGPDAPVRSGDVELQRQRLAGFARRAGSAPL
jgi:hypothetical protein